MSPTLPAASSAPARGAAPAPDALQRAARGLAVIACLGSIGLVLSVIALRIGYPYELEWMEGAVLQHTQWVRSGRLPFAAPSPDFSPFFYPPFFYFAAAPLAAVLGDGFLPLRLVSLLASAGTASLVFWLIRRESDDRVAALLGAALFASCYWLTSRWYDVGRIDNLSVCLALLGASVVRHGRGTHWPLLAGIVFWLAVFTKQTAVVLLLPVLGWCSLQRPEGFWRLAGSFLGLSALSFAALHLATDGWFSRCMLELTSGRNDKPGGVAQFFLGDLLQPLPLVFALLAAAALGLRRRHWAAPGPSFALALVAGGFAASFMVRIKVGAWSNNVIPTYAVTSIAFGLAVARIASCATRGPSPLRRRLAALAVAGAGLQVAAVGATASPFRWVPSDADLAAGDKLVALLRAVDGPVLVSTAPYLAERAGKQAAAHFVNVRDLQLSDRSGPYVEPLLAAMRDRLARGHYDLVLLANPQQSWFVPLPASYAFQGRVIPEGEFVPRSGSARFVPAFAYLRRGAALRPPQRREEPGAAQRAGSAEGS